MKHRARATLYTFSAGQALGIFDDLPIPGMHANIDPDWAIEGTYPALDTFFYFWHDMPSNQCANAVRFITQSRSHLPIRGDIRQNIPLDKPKSTMKKGIEKTRPCMDILLLNYP
jgi:hypothetical protein